MRAKSEIIESLTQKMSTSDVWKKLKNGLLGRELLALGAEIISESENVKDTMLLQLNPETADKYGLYLLSQMNEIPITNIKPSSIVVQMASNSKTYAPFELVHNFGNVAFYNIEYTMKNKAVSLICGQPKTITSDNAEIVMFYDGGKTYSGIKLGNAYPDSISVFNGTNDLEIPRYYPDTALSNTIDIMYKVVTSSDGMQYIRFICSDGTTEPYSYYINYLDHSASDFDFDDSDLSIKDGNTIIGEIKYTSQGDTDNLEYMRGQLKAGMSIFNGLNTPKSIERYVNNYPFVIDCKCMPSSDGGVDVYVKPSSDSDLRMYLDFSEIAAHISLNTILFPNVRVKTGNKLKFGLSIGGIKDEIIQNNVKNMLQKTFAYDNMKFNSMVNVSQVLSEIYSNFGIVPSVNMTVNEDFVNEKPLSYVPIKNSFKGYDATGALIAWEHDGMLYGKDSTATSIPFFMFDVVCAVGKMFLLKMNVDYTVSSDSKDNYVTEFDQESYNAVKEYNTYYEEVEIPVENKYNMFYLYDASTDMIKPFDNTMNMLILSDTYPAIHHRCWHTDKQMFGNLYDIEPVSVNGGASFVFIYKSSGTETTDGGLVGTKSSEEGEINDYKNWNKNNPAGYAHFLNGGNVSLEKNADFVGKFQTMITVNQSPALMDLSSDAWNKSFAADGVNEWFPGFYDGMKNYDNRGVKHNIYSNLFLFEENVYWIKQITDNRIVITAYRGATKDIVVPINGIIRGMIPYESSLYIVLDQSIIKIEGFSGMKQRIKTYSAYKDYNTPMRILAVERGFDNNIIIKTTTEILIGDGFEQLSESKMSFSNLKQIFESVDIAECEIGSCTNDYATIYKKVDEGSKVSTIFYCCDLNTKEVYVHDKTSYGSESGESTENVVWWDYENMPGNNSSKPPVIGNKQVGDFMGMYFDSDVEFESINTENNTVTYNVKKVEYTLAKSPNDIYTFNFTEDYGSVFDCIPLSDTHVPTSAGKYLYRVAYKDYSAEAILRHYVEYFNANSEAEDNLLSLTMFGYIAQYLNGSTIHVYKGHINVNINKENTTPSKFLSLLASSDEGYVAMNNFLVKFYLTNFAVPSVTFYYKIWVNKKITSYSFIQPLTSQSKVIGWIDYKTNKVVNETGIGIDTITYDCKSPNIQDDTYLVLDENAINFE